MRPMPELRITELPVSELVEYENNAKLHPHEQVDQIANSISEFGNNDPIAVWHNEHGEPEIVEGHGRLMALRKLGIETAPVIYLDHLTDEQRRAYALVHNKLTMNSDFDFEILADELAVLDSFDMGEFGFDVSVSIDGFGEDFSLPDGDAPHYRHVALELSQEQFGLLCDAADKIDRDSVHLSGGNEMGDKVTEIARQWLA